MPIPGTKVRALLTVLLIHAGEPVSADRLIDQLWGRSQPSNPAGSLQVKVSQLRRALEQAEPGARALLASCPSGYVLQIGADAVDVGRFGTLLARARAAGEPARSVALLAEALAIWRGPALADFADDGFAQPAIAGLEEQRLTAVEEHIEARLALGEHNALVGELDTLVATHPLRERLRAAQMRALYRAGRQAEALESYQQLRTQLGEQLGLDPGPELARLLRAILTHDPALAGPTPPARRRTNLPAPLSSLVGRADAVAQVRTLLDTGRLVTLTGPGGVGKTRLAIQTATQLVDELADGAWIVELAGRDDPWHGRPAQPPGAAKGTASCLAELVAASLGVRDDATLTAPPAGERGTLTERLPAALHGKQLLLVLDNCEHATGQGSVVLVTGEAGIGKTSLVSTFLDTLNSPIRVLAGGCDDLSTPRTLGPLRDAMQGTQGPPEPTRQAEVLTLLADGLTNAEIAQQLVLSVRTVDHHVAAILTKLGASTRRQAVTTARAWELE